MIKLIASDMDGTLLSSHVGISKMNQEAIKKAQNQGIEFMVATGRSFTEARPVLDEVGIRCGMILGNGAQIVDADDRVIHTEKLDIADVSEIISILEKSNLYFEIMTSEGVFSNNMHARIEKFALVLLDTIPHLTFKMAIAMASTQLKMLPVKHIDHYTTLIQKPGIEILKIISFSERGQEDFQVALSQLEKNPSLFVTSSFPNNLEINHVNATKGNAIQFIAEQKGISMEDVLAVGDNYNDLSMLSVAGVSFAMGNGVDKVKETAKYETDTNTADGVGKAILRAIEEQL